MTVDQNLILHLSTYVVGIHGINTTKRAGAVLTCWKLLRIGVQMDIDDIIMLPKIITSSENLINEFKELLSSDEAKEDKGVVYFFISQKPIPRVKGQSNILYIGKTNKTLNQRYFRYATKLASNRSGDFYKYIINNFGGVSLGYIKTANPKATEAHYFKEYRDFFLEYPPKSKVG
jgi:hypothetical protein